eukprot:Sspe_Gene.68571::Locus_40428_Transcript_1_1_Confidence_1.000_Length_1793::g.68571::m.68571
MGPVGPWGGGRKWNAWVALSAALTVQFCTGNLYLFGTYSERLKEVLFAGDPKGQSKLQLIALMGNVTAFMPLAGIFYDSPLGGPFRTVMVGVVLTFAGYYLLHRVALGWDCGLALACVFAGLWGHGSGYYDAAGLTTGIKNLPDYHGLVIGMQKAFLCFAGTVVTQSNFALFDGDGDDEADGVASYLLFISMFCTIPAFIAAFFLQETVPAAKGEHSADKRFKMSYLVLCGLSFFTLVVGLLRAFLGDLGHLPEIAIFAVSVLAVFGLFAALPYGTAPYIVTLDPHCQVLPDCGPEQPSEEDPLTCTDDRSMTPLQAMRTTTFWLLFVALGIGTGGGLSIINNGTQIVKSQGGSQREAKVANSLLYVCNSVGRLGNALLGERMQERGVPRPVVFGFTLFLHGMAQALLAIPSSATVFPGFCLAGFSYGGMQAVFPALLFELFGVRFFASNYMWMMFAPSFGALGFSTLLASSVYEHYQIETDDGEITCNGSRCFLITHVVIGVACLFATLLTFLLHRRTRRILLRKNRASVRCSLVTTATVQPAPT